MKITDDGKLNLYTTEGHVKITISEGLDQCTGECLIIDISDAFVDFIKLKNTDIFKLIIYPSKQERTKAWRVWHNLVKNVANKKDILEATKCAKKNWQILAETGKQK